MKKDSAPIELLLNVFRYREDGNLIWLPRMGGTRGDSIFNSTYAGNVAGAPHQNGYLQVGFKRNGVSYKELVHRVIFAMHVGRWVPSVDHVDNNRLNNRIDNLREADASENNRNRRDVKSRSGFKGVCQRPSGKFHSQIAFNKTCIHIGVFSTAEDAAMAYDLAASQLFGEYARTNQSMGLL